MRLHVPTLAARLQSSRSPHLDVPTPAAPTACVLSSIPRHTSTSTHLQRISRAPEFHTSTFPRLHTCNTPPELQSSIPLLRQRLQRISRAPELHTSTPPCLHACSASPYLLASSSLHLQCASRAPHLHVATPTARLQSSILLYLCVGLRFATLSVVLHAVAVQTQLFEQLEQTPSKFHACRPAVFPRSAPTKLPNSIPPCPHVSTPAARLQSGRTPYVHICTPAARLQSGRTPYLHVCTHAAHLQNSYLSHAYSAPLELPSSIPPHLHTRNAPPSSRAQYLYASTSARPQRTSRTPYLSTSISTH